MSSFQNRKWFVDKSKIKCHFLFFKADLTNFFSDKLFSYKLQYFYNKTKPLFIIVSEAQMHKYQEIFNDIFIELKEFKSDSEHIIRSLLYFTLIKLNRIYSENHQLSSETENNTVSFIFNELLQNEVKNTRAISFYSERLGVSRITLNKGVKKQFGITSSEMINEFILFEIKSLLLHTTLNINEIAQVVNFSEPNHLSRFFKLHSNITPVEFRNNYQIGSFII